jgi:hypothetical protein
MIMNKSVKIILSFIFLAVLMVSMNESFAQCAMCKANAESSLRNGSTIAKGLNSGILYLMAIPYLMLAFIFREQLKSLYFRMKARFTSK